MSLETNENRKRKRDQQQHTDHKVQSLPPITPDFMQLLCQYLSPRDIESCSRVNKQWYHCFKARERPILQRFFDYILDQTGMSVDPPTLKSFSRLKLPTNYRSITDFVKADRWLQELIIRSGFTNIKSRIINMEILFRTTIRDPGHIRPDRFYVSIQFQSARTNELMEINMYSKFKTQTWNVYFLHNEFLTNRTCRALWRRVTHFWKRGVFYKDFLRKWPNYIYHASID